jgi:hypothetical protein
VKNQKILGIITGAVDEIDIVIANDLKSFGEK